jgi:sucrose phosphorylase
LSAITEPEDDTQTKAAKFLAAQSILLSFIGVPAVYYHSFLGSENDVAGMEESGINRRINRKKFSVESLEAELAEQGSLRNNVYSEMVRLLNVRQQQSAFSPSSSQQVLELGDGLFGLQRGEGDKAIRFVVNLSQQAQSVTLNSGGKDLVSDQSFDNQFTLNPYQFVWLTEQ